MSEVNKIDIDVDLARCALANLENMEKANPMLKLNPFWRIPMAQLAEALGDKSRMDEIEREAEERVTR